MRKRPDGTDCHGEMDGWADHEGKPLSIAWAPSVKVTSYAGSKAMPWGSLIVDHKVYPSKGAAPLWSPVVLSDKARKASSVEYISALVYDFDSGAKWSDVIDVVDFAGWRYWAYTTWSHCDDAHKFRLVIAIDEAIPAGEYRAAWQALRAFMSWDVDEACKDLCRLYYVPSCRAGSTPWQAWSTDGIGVDWRRVVEWWNSQAPKKTKVEAAISEARAISERRQIDYQALRDDEARNSLRRILDQIPPDMVYGDWIRMGAIMKGLGMENEYIALCKRGEKYKAGEPERKLASFKR
jgi:hypothetical protein